MPHDDVTIYRRAFHTSPDAMTISRLDDGVIEDANPSFFDLTGFCRDEVIGRTASELGIYRDPSARAKMVRRVLHCGTVSSHEVAVMTKDGDHRVASLSAAIVPAAGDIRLFAAARDVTESRLREAAVSADLETARRELESRVSVKVGCCEESLEVTSE